ncbi:MAG TPA: hypothetical protein VFC74_00180 [Oscillospiraceae bacterium]|nr:hypothetical protein [Oscillospiraceae bacterium]
MEKKDINLELSLANYEEAVAEISKLLDFLPADKAVRKEYVDAIANKLLWL